MLLFMAAILAVCSAWLELSMVRRVPVIKKILLAHPFLPIVCSVLLSLMLGSVFGATGLVVMVAGIGSTIMTQPYYWFLRNQERLYLSMSRIVVVRHAVPRAHK